MSEPSDDQLMKMVIAADDEAYLEGFEPKNRAHEVLHKVMSALGYPLS